jgi:hypothetical protein
MDIQLLLINESETSAHTRIVFFQKNNAANAAVKRQPIAWRVFPAGQRGFIQKIHISQRLSVAAKDAHGSLCEQHLTEYDQSWDIVNTRTRDWMVLDRSTRDASDRVGIRNSLIRSVVTAQIYKDGRLLAEQPELQSNETAYFHFDNTVFIGITSENLIEGETIPAGSLRFVTELPLEGFAKADLVLTNTGDEYRFRLLPAAVERVLVHA